MWKQIKYAARDGLGERLSALAFAVVVNVVCLIISEVAAIPHGIKVLGIVLSSLSLLGLFIAAIIADDRCVRGLFGSPVGYNVFLTPVPRWKVLLGRIIPMAVMDLAMLAIGTVGVVVNSMKFAGHTSFSMFRPRDFWVVFATAASGLLQYLMLLLLIFLAGALASGVFFKLRARMLFAVAGAAAVAYACNIMTMILAPIMYVERWGIMFSLNFTAGPNLPTFAYLLLLTIQNAALFALTVYIMERKVNI